MKITLLTGNQKSNHTTKHLEDIFAQSHQFPLIPMCHPLPENASVLGAGSQRDARPPLPAAIEGCRFLLFIYLFVCLFIFLFLAVMGLRCCTRAFSSCGEQGLLFLAVRGLHIAVASLVAEHRL